MAPEVAEVVWYAEDSVSPLTVAKPAGFTSGDLLIAVIVQHNNPSAQSDLSVSADWTLEGNYDGTISDAKIFSHIYDPADPSTWSFVYRATADVCLGLFRITGADQAPVITITSTAFASTTASMDAPDLSPAGADDLLISVICDHGNGGAFTVTDPAGMTDLGQVQVANLYMAAAAAHEALVSNANPGVRTWTNVSRTGTTGGTISIAVKSPASADPLDPIVNAGPPWWIARQIAMAQTRLRPQDDPPGPGIETGLAPLALTTTGAAVKVASCSGRTGLALGSAGTETRTDVYVAETFSSVQSDGLGNGSAITTARTYTGDYLIVAVTDSQSATPPTAPGGWTEITLPDTDQGTNFEVHVYQLLNPAAQTTYTWTVTGGRRTIMGALVRGASTTTLLDEADSLETASGTSHTSPSVTTLGTNRAILAFDVLRGFPTSTWSQTSGWLEYVEAVGADATTNMQVSLQARTAPTATAYSDTFVCSVAEPAIVVLLAVIPLVGGGAGATAENGTTLAALTAAGTARKTGIDAGAGQLAITAAGTARKTGLDTGTAQVALSAAGAARKVASQTGTARVGIVATAAARKTATTAGTAAAALTAAGTDRKTGIDAGTATLALRSAGTDTKSVSRTGTTQLALTSTESASAARAQTGTCTLAATSTGTARKSVSRTGTTQAGIVATGAARRTAVVTGRSMAALVGTGVQVKRATPTATATLGVLSTGTARKTALGAGRSQVGLASSALELKRAPVAGRALLVLVARRSPADIRSATGRTTLALLARLHICTTRRPGSGTTSRGSSGITAYSLATTARPSSGITTRPDTGITEDPC